MNFLHRTNLVQHHRLRYIDSCASTHIVSSRENFNETGDGSDITISTASGELKVQAVGVVSILADIPGTIQPIKVKDALYVPKSKVNLLLVSKIVDKGYSVMFTPHDSKIIDASG